MYSLTVHVVGAGVVGSLDGNIHCTEACDQDPSCRECDSGDVYRTDDRIPLTAYPQSGQKLSAIDGALCAVEAAECIVTIVGDRAVTFTFAPQP